MEPLRRYPEGVELNELSKRVFDALCLYTSFPWPILRAQCNRHGVDPANLDEAGLWRVIPDIASGVARFTSPDKGDLCRRQLEELLP